jgi:hypothetical protein
MSETVGTIQNANKLIHVRLNDFKGKTYVDIRHFFKGTTDYIPSKKGISIEIGQISELISILEGVEARMAKVKGQNANV